MQIIHCIDIKNQHEETNTTINFHIKQNAISNIVLNIGKYFSDNDYGQISDNDKSSEYVYYLVKCTSDRVNITLSRGCAVKKTVSSIVSYYYF